VGTDAGQPKRTEPRIVALACSAGGLEALREVLLRLPADFDAAVVVLRHEAPGHSPLAGLLARSCALPVAPAAHDDELVAGRVYVVPAGAHALVTLANRIMLLPAAERPPYRPSADLLFTSLALVAGPRTIAVVLSGSGHDGAIGAEAVHTCGGTVLAADEASSVQFSMPASAIARRDTVDQVLPVTEIAGALVSLLTVPS